MIAPSTLTWLIVGCFLVYLVSQDANVIEWLILQSRVFRIWLERQWFKIRYNPDSPWVRYEIYRNAEKLAREIMKENENR